MLVEDGSSVGLFNLCVRPELRRKGLGAKLVRAVQAAASATGKPVVLQCEPDLAPWYKTLGFEPVGTVEALTLSQEGGGDIIA
jgi:predicted N-acetyltransferase YhbS